MIFLTISYSNTYREQVIWYLSFLWWSPPWSFKSSLFIKKLALHIINFEESRMNRGKKERGKKEDLSIENRKKTNKLHHHKSPTWWMSNMEDMSGWYKEWLLLLVKSKAAHVSPAGFSGALSSSFIGSHAVSSSSTLK